MLKLNDIKIANEKIKDVIIRTPIVESIILSNDCNANVFLKLENLQRTGSFKIRGATNKIYNLTEQEKKKGIIASSAGNHAQGVALACKLNNIPATIVMPTTAPLSKVNATLSYGARVIQSGDTFDEAYKKALEIQEAEDLIFLHAFNDEDVIAGQGSLGLEIYEDMPDVDTVIIPIGGGGLITGSAIALKEQNPNIKIIGIESEGAASMKDAIEKNEINEVKGFYTIADGIAVRKVGQYTFDIAKKYVDEIYTVSDEEITRAILLLIEKSKIISEGAGASGVAAILSGIIDEKYIAGKNVCIVISGGNVDVNELEKYINKAQILENRRVELELIANDIPGQLHKFTAILKEHNVNILYINQSRYDTALRPREQKIEAVIEVKDKKQMKELIADLKENDLGLINY